MLIAGHCRNAATELPRGVLGVATAEAFLAALPEACRRRLPDVTGTGPKLFAVLVEHGLLAAIPSPRVVPAALVLVAGVSPLLEARSARLWTLWLARVHETGSAVLAALRARTPASQLGVRENLPVFRSQRAAALRAERDRLLAEISEVQAVAERRRDELAALRIADDQQRTKIEELGAKIAELQARNQEIERERTFFRAEQTQLAAQIQAVRRELEVSDDDPRDVVTLVAAEVRARCMLEAEKDGLNQQVDELEAACEILRRAAELGAGENDRFASRAELEAANNRAAKAERELSAARKSLNGERTTVQKMTEKLERRKFQLHSVQRHIESLELELVQADIELKLRRNRQLFPPTPAEIHAAREAEAARTRNIQEKRRPLTDDDDMSAGK